MEPYLSLADKLTDEAAIDKEIGQRVTIASKLRTLTLPEGLLDQKIGLFNEGTIITLVSRGGSDYIEGLVTAIAGKKASRIQLHCEAIIERTRNDTKKIPKSGGLQDIPVIVDVLYGNVWLAKHIMIGAHTQIALSAAVWSGGKLNNQKFRVMEHRMKKSKDIDIQILTILIPPKLTKIERSVLKAVPEELSEVHIKGPSVAWSAGGLAVKWTPEKKRVQGEKLLVDIQEFYIPEYEKYQQYTTVQQRQVQQENTKQQQQQQQHYNQDGQNHQQQQQLQQDDKTQQQQQQQDQQQQANTEQKQQQQQQQAEGQQNQNQNQHDAATNAGGITSFRDDLDGGFLLHAIDQERYASLLNRIDFESMDATQSVKELLRLRERLLTIGLG
jgi:hypothetical protein